MKEDINTKGMRIKSITKYENFMFTNTITQMKADQYFKLYNLPKFTKE